MLENCKCVIFDMDGVLYNTMPYHEKSWIAAFWDKKQINFEAKDAYLNEGRTGKGTINLVYNQLFGRNATQEEVDLIYDYKSNLFKTFPPAPILDKMDSLIELLRSKNIKTLVATGSKQLSQLERLSADFGFLPNDIISGKDVKIGKPDPEPYNMAVSRSGFSKEECVVVENAPLGVRSAKAANIFTIAVNTGKLSDEDLLKEKCDILFCDTKNLYDFFAKQLK